MNGRHVLALALISGWIASAVSALPAPRKATITIHAAGQPLNTIVPVTAFGAGVDGRDFGDAPRTFTKYNIGLMRSAGFGPLTYRLRTELAIETWHWNAVGTWSEPVRKQGYWTSSADPSTPLGDSYGYRLPRRGSTTDQANNDGYSRIDDGDESTFWKSNPYLDTAFTKESNDRHPQWIAIDFRELTAINAIRITWRKPFAGRYSVQYCSQLDATDYSDQVPQCWEQFPNDTFTTVNGETRIDRLAREPVRTRFLRIVLRDSCDCTDWPSSDVRDRVGFAIRELNAGFVDASGAFHDEISHARGKKQTDIVVSSTDPWHSAEDMNRGTEQPGFDRVFASGLTSGQPLLVPVGVLYDTPENAAALVRSLLGHRYPIEQIEMGEEPDGQYVTPEDYGALFIQVADAIHAVAPGVKLGGPCFQTTVAEYRAMSIVPGDRRTWFKRFLDYLAERGRSNDFTFFTFEWYPFDDVCAPSAPQLLEHPRLLTGVIERLESDGLSPSIPWMLTEYGYSAFAGRAEVDIEGALLNAETVGLFLTLGGDRAYLYGFEPSSLMDELSCGSWGNNAMFVADDAGQARSATAVYRAARLITQRWVVAGKEPHQVFAVTSDATRDGMPLVTAYALRRPDFKWSLLVINKDPTESYLVAIETSNGSSHARRTSAADVYSYSAAQYRWRPNGEHGRPAVNKPPVHSLVPANERVTLPPYSLSVVTFAQ